MEHVTIRPPGHPTAKARPPLRGRVKATILRTVIKGIVPVYRGGNGGGNGDVPYLYSDEEEELPLISVEELPLISVEELPMVRVASRLLQEAKEATIPTKFSETNKLHFEDLPNLRSLSSGETIELPSLEHVIVNHCPNLKKFGLGTIKSSQLKSLILDDQVQGEDNIDTKIAHIF
ncbi:uncharacterized protein LOC114915463 [Cajanus cajan]|uniref:uncharacterized protein LOC114915463 n=1 Tax=Cajanus cajan TaxID=3821 RepID=UPI0010FB3EEC|nr:uncharacterized protein LOC114915463 [Cajanus cajan]